MGGQERLPGQRRKTEPAPSIYFLVILASLTVTLLPAVTGNISNSSCSQFVVTQLASLITPSETPAPKAATALPSPKSQLSSLPNALHYAFPFVPYPEGVSCFLDVFPL